MTTPLTQFPEELIESASFHYGLMIVHFSGAEDVPFILGHHDARRAVAALNHYSREDCRLPGVFDDPSATYVDAVSHLEKRWAKFIIGFDDIDDRSLRDNEYIPCLSRRSIEEGGWLLQYNCTADEPDVFPVMVWQE